MSGGGTISMRTNFPAIARQLEALPEKIGNRALVRALNVCAEAGRPAMARQVSQEFRLTVSQVRERLSVVRAYARGTLRFEARLQASNKARGRSMNLIAFTEKSVTMAAARKRMKAGEGGTHTLRNGAQTRKALELRFQVKRGGGKKVITGAFIGNKGRTVFIREGKERTPIRALSTIDVPQMFNAQRINAPVRKVMIERFPAAFKRELRSVLQGWVK